MAPNRHPRSRTLRINLVMEQGIKGMFSNQIMVKKRIGEKLLFVEFLLDFGLKSTEKQFYSMLRVWRVSIEATNQRVVLVSPDFERHQRQRR